DPDVESAKLGHGSAGQLLGPITDVSVDDEYPPTPLLYRQRRHLEIVTPSGVHHDVAAGVREPPSDRPADPLAPARADRDLPFHPEEIEQAHWRDVRGSGEAELKGCKVCRCSPPALAQLADTGWGDDGGQVVHGSSRRYALSVLHAWKRGGRARRPGQPTRLD